MILNYLGDPALLATAPGVVFTMHNGGAAATFVFSPGVPFDTSAIDPTDVATALDVDFATIIGGGGGPLTITVISVGA